MGLILGSTSRFGSNANLARQQPASLESFNHDGTQIARRRNHRRQLPLRQIAYFLIAVVSFKVFLFFDMGAGAYGAKTKALLAGNSLEKLAGHAMQLDPVSLWFVNGVRFGRW